MKMIFASMSFLFLLHTSINAQQEWDVLNLGFNGFPDDADFIGNYGWIAGYENLLKSDDNGLNWREIDL